MKLLWVLTLILYLTGPGPEGFSLVSYFRDSILELKKTGAELHHQGTVTKVTTRNMWISENEENNLWVVDVRVHRRKSMSLTHRKEKRSAITREFIMTR